MSRVTVLGRSSPFDDRGTPEGGHAVSSRCSRNSYSPRSIALPQTLRPTSEPTRGHARHLLDRSWGSRQASSSRVPHLASRARSLRWRRRSRTCFLLIHDGSQGASRPTPRERAIRRRTRLQMRANRQRSRISLPVNDSSSRETTNTSALMGGIANHGGTCSVAMMARTGVFATMCRQEQLARRRLRRRSPSRRSRATRALAKRQGRPSRALRAAALRDRGHSLPRAAPVPVCRHLARRSRSAPTIWRTTTAMSTGARTRQQPAIIGLLGTHCSSSVLLP